MSPISNSQSSFPQQLEGLFQELIEQQQDKVLRTARVHYPYLTGDDILNPHDFPKLMQDPIFSYEDGITAGLMAAQMAIRAHLIRSGENRNET